MVENLLLLSHLLEIGLLWSRRCGSLHQGDAEELEDPGNELPGREWFAIFDLIELILT